MHIDAAISRKDAIRLTELIAQCGEARSKEDLLDLMLGVKEIIPFDYGICVMAAMNESGERTAFNAINLTYPMEWLYLYVSRHYEDVDPVFLENFASYRLQYWDDTFRRNPPPDDFSSISRDFGLARGYTHGVHDPGDGEGSLFSFAGCTERYPRTERLIEQLIPHLHEVLKRVAGHRRSEHTAAEFSTTETDVLNWMKQGKSPWDISALLHVSEHAVLHHIREIARKLKAGKRSQVVSKALASRVITLD